MKHSRHALRTAPLTRIVAGMLVVYWSTLCIATHLPGRLLGTTPISSDKAQHFLAYAGLGFLLAVLLPLVGVRRRRSVWVALLVAAAYGAADELGQIPVPGRTAELGDWIADVIGAAAGVTCSWLVMRAMRGKFRPGGATKKAESTMTRLAASRCGSTGEV